MLDTINILKLASSMARHSADRHQLISQNIANADTSGFKAKDLEPFADAYQRLSQNDGQAPAQSGHTGQSWRETEIITQGTASPNGNTVSLEDQMIRSADALGAHEAATTIYKKSIDLLRTSLGRG